MEVWFNVTVSYALFALDLPWMIPLWVVSAVPYGSVCEFKDSGEDWDDPQAANPMDPEPTDPFSRPIDEGRSKGPNPLSLFLSKKKLAFALD